MSKTITATIYNVDHVSFLPAYQGWVIFSDDQDHPAFLRKPYNLLPHPGNWEGSVYTSRQIQQQFVPIHILELPEELYGKAVRDANPLTR